MSDESARAEFRWNDRDEDAFAWNDRTADSVAAASRALMRLKCVVSRDCSLDYALEPGIQAGSFACKLCQEGPAAAAAAFEDARWRAGKRD